MNGHSLPLRQALHRLPSEAEDDQGLLPELPVDAVLSRVTAGDETELWRSVPRLLTLLVSGTLSVDDSVEVMEVLRRARSDDRWSTVVAVFDAWWIQTLQADPIDHDTQAGASLVLGLLARSGEPMVRWLHVWLNSLDGVPARHLAEVVTGGLRGRQWDGRRDEADQVLAWAGTEAVVNGLALVGATHVDPDRLADALDRLLPG